MTILKKRFYSVAVLFSLCFLLFEFSYHREIVKLPERRSTIIVTNKIIGTTSAQTEVVLEEIIYDPLLNAAVTEIPLPDNPKYHGQKTYEYYTAITSKRSKQYQLQQYAVTDEKGFRRIDDRYLVAVGTYFQAPTGTYIDIVLENGTVIPCIVGDIKANKDTDANNVYSKCGCASEFMVDKTFVALTGCKGDVSNVMENWNSKVIQINVYHLNYLENIKSN